MKKIIISSLVVTLTSLAIFFTLSGNTGNNAAGSIIFINGLVIAIAAIIAMGDGYDTNATIIALLVSISAAIPYANTPFGVNIFAYLIVGAFIIPVSKEYKVSKTKVFLIYLLEILIISFFIH